MVAADGTGFIAVLLSSADFGSSADCGSSASFSGPSADSKS